MPVYWQSWREAQPGHFWFNGLSVKAPQDHRRSGRPGKTKRKRK